MITLFFQNWFRNIGLLCILVLLGEWEFALTPVAPMAVFLTHVAFWVIVILSGMAAYQETSDAHEKMREEHQRNLPEKQG